MSSDPRLIRRRADVLMRWFIAPEIAPAMTPVPSIDGRVMIQDVSLIGCGLGFHGELCPWSCRHSSVSAFGAQLREWQAPHVRAMLAR